MSGSGRSQVSSTAGAIPVKNEKGQMAMVKVKVNRYIAGTRPDFPEDESSSDEEESFAKPQLLSRGIGGTALLDVKEEEPDDEELAETDSRLRRLMERRQSSLDEEPETSRPGRFRRIQEPEIVQSGDLVDDVEGRDVKDEDDDVIDQNEMRRHLASSDEEDDDFSDEEIARRRQLLRLKLKEREREDELLAEQEESADEAEEEEEESEYDEYTDSEDETAPRLKPVFVRKRDRLTLQETEREMQRVKEMQIEQKKLAEERKKYSVKLVEEINRKEAEQTAKVQEDDRLDLTAVNTDDENEELAYEAWKLRELKRIKRDKEERDQRTREKAELERIHNMTEEERRAYLRANPKLITNKAQKGKYKFLQKYYHRGAFFLDNEDNVYKRNFSEPTLEDNFNKIVLPKVMQVKDFGKAGRTKWTHLVAEDTTDFYSPWSADTQQNIKFHQKHAAGVKDVFERPSAAKKRRKV